MINHARTLLLNQSSVGRPAVGELGEEYIPPNFVSQDLTTALTVLHGVLYGTYGDPLYQNYRTAQYTAIMHALPYTELLVFLLDQRITYDDSGLFDIEFGSTATVLNDQGMTLELFGRPKADSLLGRSQYSWTIDTTDGSEALITDNGINYSHTVPLTVADGVSNTISLGGEARGVSFRILAPTGSIEPSAKWLINSVGAPDLDLGEIFVNVQNMGEGSINAIFTTPPITFRNLWIKGNSLVDRFGGLLGAAVWGLDELLKNG